MPPKDKSANAQSDLPVSLRLPAADLSKVDAQAAAAGMTRSAFLRAIITDRKTEMRPTIVVTGDLFGICHRLIRAARRLGDEEVEREVLQSAREILVALQQSSKQRKAAT